MTAFIADENIPRTSVRLLRSAGYDVLSISEDFSSLIDEEILNLGNKTGRIIITLDRDFGNLIFKRKITCLTGVVFLRLGSTTPREPGELILSYLSSSPDIFTARFSVVDRARIRRIDL